MFKSSKDTLVPKRWILGAHNCPADVWDLLFSCKQLIPGKGKRSWDSIPLPTSWARQCLFLIVLWFLIPPDLRSKITFWVLGVNYDKNKCNWKQEDNKENQWNKKPVSSIKLINLWQNWQRYKMKSHKSPYQAWNKEYCYRSYSHLRIIWE